MTTVRRAPQFRLGDRALEAKRRLEQQKIYLPKRPERPYPEIPDDPTALHDEDLIGLMTQLTKWAEHLGTQLACAEVDERWAQAAMDKYKALGLLGRVKDVTERKAKVYESEEFLAAEEKYHEAMAYRKMVQVLYENADRFSALMSRELTRRVNIDPRSRRSERYNS